MRHPENYQTDDTALWPPPGEMAGPGSALTAIFDTLSPGQCKKTLYQILQNPLLHTSFQPDTDPADFLEKIVKMIDAAYLLYHKEEEEQAQQNSRPDGEEESAPLSLKNADWVNTICSLLPVECIFELRTPLPEGQKSSGGIIVVISGAVSLSPPECEVMLTDVLDDMQFTVFKASFLAAVALNQGTYFSSIFRNGRIYYQSGSFEIPPPFTGTSRSLQKAFEFRVGIARSFLDGAETYSAAENWRMAAFMCQQSTEHTLLAALDLTMGITPRSHNLARMVRLVGHLIPAVSTLYETEAELLELMVKSYSKTRYHSGFEISREEAGWMLAKASDLLKLVEKNLLGDSGYPEQAWESEHGSAPPGEEEPETRIPDAVLRAIRTFFDAIGPDSFRKSFFYIMTAYGGFDFYRYGEPVAVLNIIDNLRDLMEVLASWAKEMNNSNSDTQKPAYEKSQVFHPGQLPATAHERPFDIVTNFFLDDRHAEWDADLESIQFFALCRQSGIEDGEAIDTLAFYHDIVGLIEACRIIVDRDKAVTGS